MNLSVKMSSISPSPTLSIDAKYKEMLSQGIDVVGFGAGEPDFDTPDFIKEAAIEAIKSGFTKYTPASGTLELRQAICDKLRADNGLEYKPGDIVVSNGAKHSLVNVFCAILNPGDEVIIPTPYWVSYPEMVKIADGTPVYLTTTEKTEFKFSAQEFKAAITPKTKAIIMNSPSNPTGMAYTKKEFEEIAKVAVENNIFVVADEIYEKLIYEGEHFSIASFGDEIKELTITVNGLSKSHAMTGWRIGYTASNPQIAKIMGNLQSHAASNPNSIAQKAAFAALKGPQTSVETMRLAFITRRNYMFEKINQIDGVSCLCPNGAFYIMMNINKLYGKEFYGKLINNSDEFAQCFLENQKVAVVPGSGFGDEGYVRWSYATSMENITEGLNRLEKFIKQK